MNLNDFRVNGSINSRNEAEKNITLGHQPVIITFKCDPYLTTKTQTTSLPDIVREGVLLGIYKTIDF